MQDFYLQKYAKVANMQDIQKLNMKNSFLRCYDIEQ